MRSQKSNVVQDYTIPARELFEYYSQHGTLPDGTTPGQSSENYDYDSAAVVKEESLDFDKDDTIYEVDAFTSKALGYQTNSSDVETVNTTPVTPSAPAPVESSQTE